MGIFLRWTDEIIPTTEDYCKLKKEMPISFVVNDYHKLVDTLNNAQICKGSGLFCEFDHKYFTTMIKQLKGATYLAPLRAVSLLCRRTEGIVVIFPSELSVPILLLNDIHLNTPSPSKRANANIVDNLVENMQRNSHTAIYIPIDMVMSVIANTKYGDAWDTTMYLIAMENARICLTEYFSCTNNMLTTMCNQKIIEKKEIEKALKLWIRYKCYVYVLQVILLTSEHISDMKDNEKEENVLVPITDINNMDSYERFGRANLAKEDNVLVPITDINSVNGRGYVNRTKLRKEDFDNLANSCKKLLKRKNFLYVFFCLFIVESSMNAW